MKVWYWLVIGFPALAIGGWAEKGRAADSILEFKTGTPTTGVQNSISTEQPSAGEKAPVAVPTSADISVPVPEAKHPQQGTATDQRDGTAPTATVKQPPQETPPASFTLDFSPPRPSLEQPHAAAAPVALRSLTDTLTETPLPVLKVVPRPAPPPPVQPTDLFAGGTESLVARAVGSAEGTRTPDGQKTWAYYGHVDPGNYAWNQGTFSYQHGAKSPEEADKVQLARLARQAQELLQLAQKKGLDLTKAEILNGIDLANQAPLAALDRGYIDWLVTAKKMGLKGHEAILWARTRSFIDPDTGRWNAPGLGNSLHTITHDQSRRQQAVAQAIALHEAAAPTVAETQLNERLAVTPAPVAPPQTTAPSESIDVILEINL